MSRLKVAPHQRINRMSCGQRSQVALGLILAQDPEVLVLDDFSLGLDPGYRRLFVDYMREYAKAEDKTVFLTSHIIQDMERLVDDCIVMDYGKILVQMPVEELLGKFRRYTVQVSEGFRMQDTDGIYNPSVIRQTLELFSMLPEAEVRARLSLQGVADVQVEKVGLEDAFIGLTGKY